MPTKTRAQIQAQSNVTYIDNSVGSITPTNVRALNDDWTDSTVFLLDLPNTTVGTASLALTASYLSGSFDSASYAAFATTASFALNFNPVATASYALKAELAVTASHAVTASYAHKANLATTASNALTASYVQNAQSASYILNAVSSSYALTASFAANAPSISTGSFATTGSNTFKADQIISSSGDGLIVYNTVTTQNVLVANSSGVTSNQLNSDIVSSVSGDLNLVALAGSAVKTSDLRISNNQDITGSLKVLGGITGSLQGTASYAAQVLTASFAQSIANNLNATFNNVTASNVRVTGTASIAFLNVEFQSSSVIYSSGSNILGDAAGDTQTLWGTVNVISGPLLVTGSANFQGGVTASLLGTASFASQGLSSSYALSSSYSVSSSLADAANYAVTAGFANNSATATSASFASNALTASFVAGNVTSASFAQTASFIANNRLNQNLIISGSSDAQNTLVLFDKLAPFRAAIYADGSNVGLVVSGNLFVPSGFVITGSGQGITGVISSSYSVSSSYALSSSFASNAATASFVSLAQSASYVLNAISSSFATSASRSDSSLSSSYALTASFALNAAGGAGFPYSGSAEITGSLIVSGSARGSVFSGSIASATSSIDFGTGNFFTSLVSGSTFFNVTNIKAGQTVNVLLTTAGALPATASFSSNVKQISSSLYTPTSGSGKTDILTFISFDNTNAYLVATKNLI